MRSLSMHCSIMPIPYRENWLSLLGVVISDKEPDEIFAVFDIDPNAHQPRLPVSFREKRNQKIRALRAKGRQLKDLSRMFEMSESSITRICVYGTTNIRNK